MTTQLQYQKPVQDDHAPPSRHDLAVVALRLLGLYLLIEILGAVAYIQIWIVSGSASTADLWMVWPSIVQALIGMVVLIWAPMWARLILPRRVTLSEPAQVSTSDLQAAAFAVVGVLLVAWALPNLAWSLYQRELQLGEGAAIRQGVFAGLAQIAIGVALFVQARSLASLWRRMRGNPPVRVDRWGGKID